MDRKEILGRRNHIYYALFGHYGRLRHFSAIIRNLTLCYRLGKDDTPDFIWQILPENVTLLSLLICGVLMILMMRNVRRKQVFTLQNANLIAGIGFHWKSTDWC